MKKSLKITLAGALALFLLTGCAAAPASAGESVSAAASTTQTAPSASDPDTAVSRRDASGEYDAAEAVTLSPDGDLTITEAGTYILSGEYEGMIVIEAGEEDKVQLVLENATITNESGPAIYVRSADKVWTRSFSPRRRARSTRSPTARITPSPTATPRWTRPCSAGTISRSTAPAS